MPPFGTTVLLQRDYMIGSIIIWSGLLSSIPSGWQICDGTNGTPDLRGQFVKGCSGDGGLKSTGGALTHTHPFTGNGHTHTLFPGTGLTSGSNIKSVSEPGNATGTTDSSDSQPPWMKLYYIMRLA